MDAELEYKVQHAWSCFTRLEGVAGFYRLLSVDKNTLELEIPVNNHLNESYIRGLWDAILAMNTSIDKTNKRLP